MGEGGRGGGAGCLYGRWRSYKGKGVSAKRGEEGEGDCGEGDCGVRVVD